MAAVVPFAPFAPMKERALFPNLFSSKPEQLVGHLLLRIFDSEDGFMHKLTVIAAMQTEIEGIAEHPQMQKLSERECREIVETVWDVYLNYIKPYFLYKEVYEKRKVRRFAECLAQGSLDRDSLLQVLEGEPELKRARS